MSTRADRWAAIGAGTAVFVLYIWTMPRDVLLGAGVDTAKFAYMPRVLGVPHTPGYPLYLLIGWLFSWLPIGTLAFRMNLLSACFGAVTAGLVALVLRELRCSRSIAVPIAVLAGTGHLFWSQAIVAEVYTLHTALVAGTLLGLLVWHRTRDRRALALAVLSFALGLAHHTDIATFGPAIVVFVLVTNWRTIRDVRAAATAAAIVGAALSLYAYTIIRTRQGAPFVEAGATNLAGVWALLRGKQFHYLFGVPTVHDAIHRVPLLAPFFATELRRLGVWLGVVGLVALARWHRNALLLIVLAGVGMLAFIISYHAFDIEVFLLPVFLLCWLCVGVGAEAIHRGVVAQRQRWRHAHLFVPVVMVVWTGWQAVKNFTPNNLRIHTSDARFFDRFFEELPAGSALVDNEIVMSHMALYKVLGEGADGKPVIFVVPPMPAEIVQFGFVRDDDAHRVVHGEFDAIDELRRTGHEVFAFRGMAAWLREAGFPLEPVRMLDQPLPDYLSQLEPDLIVAAAVPATAAAGLGRWEQPFAGIGGGSSVQPDRCHAIVGVTGQRRGAPEVAGVFRERVRVSREERVGASPVAPLVDIEARCDRERASIAVNGAEVAWGDSSVPVVVMNKYGAVQTTASATPVTGYRVPFEWPRLATYRIRHPRACAPLGSTWSDIRDLADAAVVLRPPADGGILLYVAADVAPPFPFTLARSAFDVRVTTMDRSDAHDAATVRGLLKADDLQTSVLGEHRYVARAEVRQGPIVAANPAMLDLHVGVARPVAFARVIDSTAGGQACAGTLGAYDLFAGCIDCLEGIAIDQTREGLYGAGWHAFEPDSTGGVRWTSAEDAHLLVALAKIGTIRLDLKAEAPAVEEGDGSISLIVNGHELTPVPIEAGQHSYQWTVPAAAWRTGVNDVVIRSRGMGYTEASRSDRRLIGVRQIVAKLIDETAPAARSPVISRSNGGGPD